MLPSVPSRYDEFGLSVDVCKGPCCMGGDAAKSKNCQTLLKEFLELPNEVGQWDTEDPADLAQFEQVQPTCSGLVVADKCLRLAECVRHIDLSKASLHPELA